VVLADLMFADLFENSMPFFVCFFFNLSSKNPEEAELEDTLNQVVRRFSLTTPGSSSRLSTSFKLICIGYLKCDS